jgi:hypothetical protein
MDMMMRQRVSTPHTEFDIIAPERYRDEVSPFWEDTVDFCFVPKPFNSPLRCHVKLYDVDTQQELLGGYGVTDLPGNADEPVWLSFSGFGWVDEQMTRRVSAVRFEAWLEGHGHVLVRVYV